MEDDRTEQGAEEQPAATEDEGPAVEELEDDPAYNPDDEELERVKGG